MPETKVVRVELESAWRPALVEAGRIIREGGLVAFPTETVYGLGANALSAEAVRRIFVAKGRPSSDPLIVHLRAQNDLPLIAREIPPAAEKLATAFWPGPLTLILQRNEQVPDPVSAGMPTVAIRVPSHPIAQALLEESERPIAAPSANRFAHTSPTTGAHVLADLQGRIDLLLDAGPTEVGVESTVLDLTSSTPTILRPGGITWEALQEILGVVDIASTPGAEVLEREGLKSPGLLDRHYAPEIPLILYNGKEAPAREALKEAATRYLQEGKRVGLLVFAEDQPLFQLPGLHTRVIGGRSDLATTARSLYAALRDLEQQELDLILARAPEPVGIGLAIRDRLIRAADKVVDI